MKKINAHSESVEDTNLFTLIKRCLLFSAIFLALSLLLLFFFSLIFIKLEDSTAYLSLIGKGSLYISALVCSFILSRINGSNRLFSGIILGAILTGLIFILSLIYPDNSQNSIIWLLLIPIITILGSIISKKRALKPSKHRKRRK